MRVGLFPLLFVHSAELARAEWREFNLKEREWHIPGERIKMRKPHSGLVWRRDWFAVV